jgi:hypothetical protein
MRSSDDQIGRPGGVSVGGKEGRRKRGAEAFKGGLGEAISSLVVCGRWGSGRREDRGWRLGIELTGGACL